MKLIGGFNRRFRDVLSSHTDQRRKFVAANPQVDPFLKSTEWSVCPVTVKPLELGIGTCMMELRTIEDLMLPDRRTTAFGPHGLKLGRVMRSERAATFVQRMIAECEVSAAVPEDVRGYFETACKLHVYGLFVYEFFTLAADRALFTCELALRQRHAAGTVPGSSGTRPPTLRQLLTWAKGEGLLSAEHDEEWLAVLADLRNFAAHPNINRIISPADSARMIELVASMINKLWGRRSTGA